MSTYKNLNADYYTYLDINVKEICPPRDGTLNVKEIH